MNAYAVKNATKASPEYKGSKALGEESYVSYAIGLRKALANCRYVSEAA